MSTDIEDSPLPKRPRRLSLYSSESEEDDFPSRTVIPRYRRFYDVIVDRLASTGGTRQGTGTRTMLALDKIAKSIGLTGIHIRCVHSKSGKGLLSKLVREHGWQANGRLFPTGQLTEPVYFYRGPKRDRVPIGVRDSRQLRELHEYEAHNTPEQEREACAEQNAGVLRCPSLEEVKEWMQQVKKGTLPNTSRTFLIADDFKVTLLLSRAPRTRPVDFTMSPSVGILTDALSPLTSEWKKEVHANE